MRVRDRAFTCTILRCPLVCASRTLSQFPFLIKQVRKEVVAPLCRRRSPGDFQAAANGVPALTGAKCIFPAQALLFHSSGFGFWANVLRRNGSAMGLAEGVPARNQCNRLL